MTRKPVRWSPAILLVLAGSTHVLAGPFPGALDLSTLDGSNGFVINGVNASDRSGWSVAAAGDVNGDGVADVIIGADYASTHAGASYVVFGGAGVGASGSLDLSTLDGSNGFVVNGVVSFDYSGFSVSGAGDVNGDGVDDVIIGAPRADPGGSAQAGESYVVFGRDTAVQGNFAAVYDPSAFDGTDGFVINGVAAGDLAGNSVSGAGDVNGDGVDDLIIGAEGAQSYTGASYVVFGGAGIGAGGALDLASLNGTNGFVINGIDASDISGASVSGAGDVNGDGVDDVVIGAFGADPNGRSFAGATYVVFGGAGVGAGGSLDLSTLNGTNGFTLNGIDAYDRSGNCVSSAGDVNGDGLSDITIGARLAAQKGDPNVGETYVVFGRNTAVQGNFPATFALSALNGTNGFASYGIDANDYSGGSVASAGDVNGDGIGDLIIGAYGADPNGQSGAGESYLVYGAPDIGFGGGLLLSSVRGLRGFVINGINSGSFFDDADASGFSVSAAGDVNDDGVDDFFIGAFGGDPNGQSDAGESYIVFGRHTCPGDLNGDGGTDVFDFSIFAGDFGCAPP